MRIGLLSDTHDHLAAIEGAFRLFAEQKVELVCHLGDWVAPYSVDFVAQQAKALGVPLKGVFGNNDGEIFLVVQKNPTAWGIDLGHHTLAFETGGRKIVLYHGTDQNLTDALVRSGAYDAVFTGHTHVPAVETIGKTLHVNPGTLSGFSGERGGRLTTGEVAVYDTVTNAAELVPISPVTT